MAAKKGLDETDYILMKQKTSTLILHKEQKHLVLVSSKTVNMDILCHQQVYHLTTNFPCIA